MVWQKSFLRDVLEMADNLVVVLDKEGKVRFFNKKARELTGYREDEVLGKPWVQTFVASRHLGKGDVRAERACQILARIYS